MFTKRNAKEKRVCWVTSTSDYCPASYLFCLFLALLQTFVAAKVGQREASMFGSFCSIDVPTVLFLTVLIGDVYRFLSIHVGKNTAINAYKSSTTRKLRPSGKTPVARGSALPAVACAAAPPAGEPSRRLTVLIPSPCPQRRRWRAD